MKKFPNLLAFETSSPVLSIALKKGKETVLETSTEGFLQHAENLIPLMDRLLRKKKLTLPDIDAFLIGRGPGSFTGLRIGFATLKGFLACQKKPCYGALSLDMIAASIDLAEGNWLGVCLDAYRKKIYIRLYKRRRGTWKAQGKMSVRAFPEILEDLPAEVTLTGDALLRYQKFFEQGFSGSKRKIHFLPSSQWTPRASSLIACFIESSRRGGVTPPLLQKLDKPRDFLPLYLRVSEAESLMNKRLAERKSHCELDPERSEGTSGKSQNRDSSSLRSSQ